MIFAIRQTPITTVFIDCAIIMTYNYLSILKTEYISNMRHLRRETFRFYNHIKAVFALCHVRAMSFQNEKGDYYEVR